ncbi:MAG: metallopeptidase family protein [Elusimicrobia bacterium]|nr:metallopeptidase family protein [Elusimicrobiota bacterium]
MDLGQFETVLREALDGLPRKFKRQLNNLEFVVEDDPSPEQVKHLGGGTLLGLYQGIPLPRRRPGTGYYGALPDKITLFRHPLQSVSGDREDLVNRIRRTVLHEIGHYFGIGDEDLRAMGY